MKTKKYAMIRIKKKDWSFGFKYYTGKVNLFVVKIQRAGQTRNCVEEGLTKTWKDQKATRCEEVLDHHEAGTA